MTNKKLLQMVYSAMFAALVCVATMIIRVPTIGTNGYVNIGDSVIFIAAWMMGNPYAAIAAAIGSGLADLLAGYPAYVPGTAVIKFLMAFVGVIVYRTILKVKLPKNAGYVASAVIAEAIMVVGYFIYEATFLGYGIAAAASIGSNVIQGVTCGIIGLVLINVLDKSRAIKTMLAASK